MYACVCGVYMLGLYVLGVCVCCLLGVCVRVCLVCVLCVLGVCVVCAWCVLGVCAWCVCSCVLGVCVCVVCALQASSPFKIILISLSPAPRCEMVSLCVQTPPTGD